MQDFLRPGYSLFAEFKPQLAFWPEQAQTSVPLHDFGQIPKEDFAAKPTPKQDMIRF